jgi:glucose/arabinose dehydrogenase
MRFSLSSCVLLFFWLIGCGDDDGPMRPDSGADSGMRDGGGIDGGGDVDGGPGCAALALEELVTLGAPNQIVAPAGDERLFITELTGEISIVRDGAVTGTFLDLSGFPITFDLGLNGLAFHPDFATNGRFYVAYKSGALTLRLASFTVSGSDPDVADPTSEATILEVTLPAEVHTSGHLAFGPDGYLYMGVGDGEMMPNMRLAEELDSLLGKILRIDVDGTAPYAIPTDNPFVGMSGVREEIWAYGFRLPYRFSFDEGALFIGEVGNNRFEEVNLVPAGSPGGIDFGWPSVEGNGNCFDPPTGCDMDSTPPIYEYAHSDDRCAMMGGFVYRGSALPACHVGRYFFADYCSGQIISFVESGGTATDVRDGPVAPAEVISWGRDSSGELYVASENGTVYQLVAAP